MKDLKSKKYPTGAISTETIDRIHLDRYLEESGAGALIPIVDTFAEGQALEDEGHYIEARELYQKALRRYPKNPWLRDALERVKTMLH